MDEGVRHLLERKGYTEAFERLLDMYEAKVFRMTLAFLRDTGRAEEVTQDIFLKLWQALPGYDGRAAVGTWLYTIARNTCLSAVRSEAYRKAVPLESGESSALGAWDKGDLELTQCVDRLPEIQRVVIRLFYLEEKRVDEVARMLGMPSGTVKSHLHRARLALGEMLKR
jgi:RNA polymerase sigma-70 factor (ECF subfamily)